MVGTGVPACSEACGTLGSPPLSGAAATSGQGGAPAPAECGTDEGGMSGGVALGIAIGLSISLGAAVGATCVLRCRSLGHTRKTVEEAEEAQGGY